MGSLHFVNSLVLISVVAFENVIGQSAYWQEGYTCGEPLLDNAEITATSSLPGRDPKQARLRGGGAWTAETSDFEQELTIDLGYQMQIRSIATQGRQYSSEFVMEYLVSYGSNGLDFAFYRGFDGSPKTFKGNTDSNSVFVNIFDPPIVAQWIRINPTRWQDRISMRVELYGCPYNPDPKAVGFDGVTFFERRVAEDRNNLERPIEFLDYREPFLRDEIRFRFKTNEAHGVLLYGWGKQNDILAVQLIQNQLVLSIGLGGKELTTLSVGSLLDDGIWHDVYISRDHRRITMSVDRVIVSGNIIDNFRKLNVDFAWFVGGVPNQKRGLQTARRFLGCMESLYINQHNVFIETPWKPNEAWMVVRTSGFRSNPLDYESNPQFFSHEKFLEDIRRQGCVEQQIVPVTFLTSDSHVKLKGYEAMESLTVSFEFRTFESEGILMYHKFYSDGYVKMYLQEGYYMVDFETKGSPGVITANNFVFPVNDGKWHRAELTIRRNKLTNDLDYRPVETTREMEIKTGGYYLFAGGVRGSRGFIGCMKNIVVDGNKQYPRNWGDEEKACCSGELLLDACRMFDRCSPNPCEHGGRCKQDSVGFGCECEGTGYTGAVCHVPRHPHSCAAHFQANPGENKKIIDIDVDGSGPLNPFPVTCQILEDQVVTKIERKTSGAIRFSEEQGQERQHYLIEYDAGLDEMDLLIDRSVTCQQFVRYACINGAPLFGQNSNTVSTNLGAPGTTTEYFPIQWFSRINKPMNYWGGAIPHSQSCFCGMYDSCIGGGRCNCDPQRAVVNQRPGNFPGGGGFGNSVDSAGQNQVRQLDEGMLTMKEDLPVSAISGFLRGPGSPGAGGTGPKEGIVYIGDLECRGDTLAEDVVTFKVPDATLDFPPIEWGQSGDIYFEFKTTALDAVLMHSRGINGDFIKVSILGGDHLQFEYQAGAGGAMAVNIETQHKIADNRWHSLRVERNRLEARMVLDEAISQAQSNNNGPVRPILLNSTFTVGATVDWRDGFVGCMRSLMVNGRQLKMSEMVEMQNTYGVATGCMGKCDSSPCLNNGTCLEGYDKYTCDCQWTAFKGPICADEIGVNMMNDFMIKYSFNENYKSTLNEYIRVGFTTTNPQGFLLGLSSDTSKEYLTLLISNSGHLRVVFDFGFERQEFVFPDHMFNAGQFHDVTFERRNAGTEMVITVDNYQPMVRKLQISGSADAQFNNINNFYIGKNESTQAGFIGCIARVQFDDIFPLRLLFQQDAPDNIYRSHSDMHEDFCGIEPVTHPPEEVETRPPPIVDRAKVKEFTQSADSAVLGGILGVIFLALVIMCIVILRLRTRDMGEYMTQEDEGAREAFDADEAVVKSTTGPKVQKKKEWFI